MSTRFDITLFARQPNLVAQLLPADSVFSLITRQITLPPACAALTWSDDGQITAHASGREIDAKNLRELLFFRTTPFPLEFTLPVLPSQDGFDFSARVRLTLEIVPERTELLAFRKTVLASRNLLRLEDLAAHCEESVRAAAAEFARCHDAVTLAQPSAWPAFDPALDAAFRPLGFASGLALGRDPQITFDSPAYAESLRAHRAAAARQQRHAEESQLQSLTAQAREQHLAELAAMLERVRSLSDAQHGLPLAQLIQSFSAAQRGTLYEGLISLAAPTAPPAANAHADPNADPNTGPRANHRASAPPTLLVVAGHSLLFFDLSAPTQPTRRIDLPDTLGGLRSIRTDKSPDGQKRLLLGAGHGVFILDESGNLLQSIDLAPNRPLKTGVNSAALLGNHLYATHSELGLLRAPLHPFSGAACDTVPPAQPSSAHPTPARLPLTLSNGVKGDVAQRCQGPDIPLPTSDIDYLTSDIPHPTSHIEPPPPEPCLPHLTAGASVIRDLRRADDNRLWFIADHRIIGWQPDSPNPPTILTADRRVESFILIDDSLIAGLDNGTILRWLTTAPDAPEILRGPTGDAVHSLDHHPGGGIPRLLIADRRPALTLLVLGDPYTVDYRAPEPLRWAAAAPRHLIAVNDTRDRLHIWNLSHPANPTHTIPLARLLPRSIQDIATT